MSDLIENQYLDSGRLTLVPFEAEVFNKVESEPKARSPPLRENLN